MTEHGLNSQTEVLYQTVNLFEFLGGDQDASAYMYCQLTLTFTFQSGMNSHMMGFCIKMLTYCEFPVWVEFPDDGVLYQDTGFQSSSTSQHQGGDVIYTKIETHF